MTTVSGIYRNGRVEFDDPVPTWADGSPVAVTEPDTTATGIDITGDSPEAIAAWIAWYDDLHKAVAGSTFPDELERLLAEAKAAELARRDDNRRAEEIFQ